MKKGTMHQTKGDSSIDKVFVSDFQNVVLVFTVTFFEIQSIILNNLSLLLDIKLELRIIKAIEFSHVLIIYFKYLKSEGLNTLNIVIICFCFSIVFC